MRQSVLGVLVGALLLGALASSAEAQLRIHTQLYRSNAKGILSAFKAKPNQEFMVWIRLYEDIDSSTPVLDEDGAPWREFLLVKVQDKPPLQTSIPSFGLYVEPLPIKGSIDLIVGASKPLPDGIDLSTTFFTTQVHPRKKGVPLKPFAESPARVLGAANVPQAAERLRILRGTVAAGVLDADGAGWSAVRDAEGVYTITFSPPFSAPPTVTANCGFPQADNYVGILSATETSAQVRLTDGDDPQLFEDAIFHFIVIGPS